MGELTTAAKYGMDISCAENCGALGIRVTAQDELDEGWARRSSHARPALVEVMADPLLV